ncbi:MAG: uroporphyrinogen decarboxylase family protein [Eubacteriales bacterium]
MTDAKVLSQERMQIFKDLFDGNVPTRIPISNPLTLDSSAQYVGMNVAEIYWDTQKIEEVFNKICTDFPADTAPYSGRRYPSFYQVLGAKPFVMSSTGHMQHPNVMGMNPEDYDEFIDSPLDCIIEKILPRLYTELDTTPDRRAMVMAKAIRSYTEEFGMIGATMGKISAKFGFAPLPGGGTTAPYDFMADFFRSFTGISKDIRRIPDKVIAACEAITPLLIKRGKIPVQSPYGMTMIPLHMGPFMRLKDFEKFYWPTLKKQIEALSAMGINVMLFVEHDFMRFLDHMLDLPANTIMRFEYGDPKLVKEKLGKKHIISGFYPVSLLFNGTKEACIDKTKELLDILAPGGGYWFDTDKSVLDVQGNFAENMQAVIHYIRENGTYTQAERSGNKKCERTGNKSEEIVKEIDQGINSKYYTTWENYLKAHPELEDKPLDIISRKMKQYEDTWYNFIINLCS